ncbi:MAG: NAD(P)-dependent alcohol dehydrogenase [Halopseudomonas aestusnigri]
MKGLVVKEKNVLQMDYTLDKPSPAAGEVLIKVCSASVNPYDVESAAGVYDTYFKEYGFDKPVQTGLEFSGIVETKGNKFNPGDRVFGYVHLITGWKTHAEYIAIPESFIAPIPSNLTFEQAAAIPLGIMTSLAAYEDLGQNKSNLKVLIIGAAGGVGVYATQIGKLFNHRITAVVRQENSDFIKSLGADEVHASENFTIADLPTKYDLILDFSTRLTLNDCQKVLTKDGIFVPALPNDNNGGNSEHKQIGHLMVMQGDGLKLSKVSHWIKSKDIVPVIEATYDFNDYKKAISHLDNKGKTGRIVMTLVP